MKQLLLLLICLCLNADIIIPQESKQLIVVSANDSNSTTAIMQAYEKKDSNWLKVLQPFNVNLGRRGLGWGKGLHLNFDMSTGPHKQEGDGKAPAGLFVLESFFGYEVENFNFPYKRLEKNDICVDDSTAKAYNTIITTHNTSAYNSFEVMRRDDELYALGIVVGHNTSQEPQKGSCIFIHVQKAVHSPTAGCTSLAKKELYTLMQWLKKEKKPLLLQLPTHHFSFH